jgi:hypothetical protein
MSDPEPSSWEPPSVVARQEWFKRFPNGGTVFLRPPVSPSTSHNKVDRFRQAPNGGGTAFQSEERRERS